MYAYQKRWALITYTNQIKYSWLEGYCENTAHTYPVLLFGISKRRRGSETSRIPRVTLESKIQVPISLGRGGEISSHRGRSCMGRGRAGQFTWRSGGWQICLEQTRTVEPEPVPVPERPWGLWMGLWMGPHFAHSLPNSSDLGSSVSRGRIPLCLDFFESAQSWRL